jgi:mannosyltransferase OCH1-like enzyme
VVCLLVIFYFAFSFDSIQESMENDNSKTKKGTKTNQSKKKKTGVPLHIYQTWHTKKLPKKMQDCVDRLVQDNPEFEHHLYDDDDCREFIRTQFDKKTLNAFDQLIPGAYKADLWRYCILYKKGGIYLDIKFQCEPGFKLIELVDREHFVLDRPYATKGLSLEEEIKTINNPNYLNQITKIADQQIWKNGNVGIYNALMVCKAGNPILLNCIQQIVRNVRNRYYGFNCLYITGPGLLGDEYFEGDYNKLEDFELFNSLNGDYIISRTGKILSHYPEYRKEQNHYSNVPYYGILWKEKKVYDTIKNE